MSSADPGGSNSLLAAASWLQHALLGSIATAVAVIAVAGVGLLMLNGRMRLGHGARVIAGCFLLFGAPVIARGILTGVSRQPGYTAPAEHADVPPPPRIAPTAAPSPQPYDPYAGASVPPN